MIAIETVVGAVLYLLIGGLIFWLLTWLVDYVGTPEPFRKVARVALAILAVLVIISVLLGLVGRPLFRWGP